MHHGQQCVILQAYPNRRHALVVQNKEEHSLSRQPRIVARDARDGEKLVTLDGEERELVVQSKEEQSLSRQPRC